MTLPFLLQTGAETKTTKRELWASWRFKRRPIRKKDFEQEFWNLEKRAKKFRKQDKKRRRLIWAPSGENR